MIRFGPSSAPARCGWSSRLALPQVQVPTRTHARCRLSFHRSPQAISARDMSISSGFPLQGRRNVENFLGATRRNVGTCWRRPAAEMLEKHVEHQGRSLRRAAHHRRLPCGAAVSASGSGRATRCLVQRRPLRAPRRRPAAHGALWALWVGVVGVQQRLGARSRRAQCRGRPRHAGHGSGTSRG